MKIILKSLAITLSVIMLCSVFTASALAQAEDIVDTGTVQNDQAIIDGIVNCFMPLAEIPRQSHHEEKVSQYLYSWAEEKGFSPLKDEQNNVIFDVPGTAGMEEAPVTILQAHMDMVIAVADGKSFDPQKDGITVINDGTTLTADGTSLGADDGMGVATILYLLEHSNCHGPMRIIFTTNEEDGMTGAFGLSAERTQGVSYVINLDSENSKEVTNSAAAGITVRYSFIPAVTEPENTAAYKIKIQGLLSGHSGVDIDKGRLNGIKALGLILEKLEKSGVDFELSKVTGGNALNAIPAKAEACIVIKPDEKDVLRNNVDTTADLLRKEYGDVETNIEIIVEGCEVPSTVLTSETKENTIRFITGIFNGINSMSTVVDGLVESSSNLGLISVFSDDSTPSTAGTYIRSSDAAKLTELTDAQFSLAQDCGITAEATKTADPWPVKADSKLLEMIKKAYKEETGTDISVVQLHAGLETGTFAQLDPTLDIVSIGFDITNPHTINETCYLKTIPAIYYVLENVLADIGFCA